jgi:hypothetical protein
MAQQTKAGTTKRDRNSGAVKEGGLPKDKETAAAGDNRRGGDVDGNRGAAGAKKAARR